VQGKLISPASRLTMMSITPANSAGGVGGFPSFHVAYWPKADVFH